MCCDICPRYDECDDKNSLKDDCCSQCPEYEYCTGENDNNSKRSGYREEGYSEDENKSYF